jgi:oligoendopeptidase F
MTFQDSTVSITTESNRETRRSLHRKRLNLIESSNDLRAERLMKLYETARSLGYESYAALFEEIRGLDYSALISQVSTILSSTETIYLARLDNALRRALSIGVEEAERSDAMYFLHLTCYDDRFPAEQIIRVYSETMAGLGIKVAAQNNITIDSEPRHRKNPRAFCTPILIPDDIRLVIRPSGGQSDYQSFLHESGHAQHYGWASTHLPPEFKYSGDYALTETYAFLFNHLISDREWLANFLRIKDSEEFIRSVMLTRLVTVRRYVAKLIFEGRIHRSGNIEDAAELYSDLQTQSTSFKTVPGEYLFDLDDSFYSASYLRAWAFEVSLRDHLKMRYGSRWWSSLRAGDFLKQIWETGDRYTADEMASQIGIGPIQFDSLIDEFNATLA